MQKVTDRADMTLQERMKYKRWQCDRKLDRLAEETKDLKPEINEFLFKRLPGTVTLEEFEKLATDVLTRICDTWEKHLSERR